MVLECGVDETGRGSCISGIYASACILDPAHPIEGLRDSKKLSARKREILAEEIKQYALSWCIAQASLEEVEQLNVHHATLLAMKRAIEGLSIRANKVYVDGIHLPEVDIPAEAIVKGDDLIPAISAASILAKVARDGAMLEYHEKYPQYGFNSHKGYLTKAHREALKKYGPSPIHRKTYAPIRELLVGKDNEQIEMFE
ncbi:Ribonuclease H [Desulforamulus reducens MI-1]|uniref:Ribonuclease HII n=1 Tax=Desulforamulus reducens (strain ATCC BAA-1160 / DSM 100696 / MI-1) TaxID=349161 RepID=RNH2_DESRM|nr:ribonuclease HII [Desulforamulus reducens]A4J661.1 RecName: Full=Ribonuclease HII; Short=RNase HII [Desulforamulus reducens MI-1]ABO50564.1 Ribonuclease H [Desulforamulus reducens MI-1]